MGQKCAACHANRTGGGKRTDYGAMYGQQSLPVRSEDLDSFRVTEVMAIGGDVRVEDAFRRFRKPESLALDPRVTATRGGNEVEARQASVYLEANLLDGPLNLYLDESFAPGATTREVFIRAEHLDTATYLKIGRFFPPYGLRLVDNSAFIRARTGYSMAGAVTGLELGLDPPSIEFTSFRLAVSDDGASGPDVSGLAEIVQDGFRVGASGGYQSGSGSDTRSVGAYGGGRIATPLQFLGEVDFVRTVVPGPDSDAIVLHLEIDYQPLKGANVRTWYGRYDPDESAGGGATMDEQEIGLSLELFPIRFLRLSAGGSFGILSDGVAAERGHDRAVELLFQTHLFF